jgi:hypothetical protein
LVWLPVSVTVLTDPFFYLYGRESGINFVLLGVAALFLILFLFAALPLGFFEFGEIVLRMIVERYVQVVIYSLGIAIFVRLAAGMVDQLPNLNNVTTLLEWLLLMIVVYLSLRAILKSSFALLSASFNTMSHSVGAVWSGAGPQSGPGLWDRTKQVAQGAMTGAVLMGGPQGALAGAAATALSLPLMTRGMMGNSASSAQSIPRAEPQRGDVFAANGIPEPTPMTAPVVAMDAPVQPDDLAAMGATTPVDDVFGVGSSAARQPQASKSQVGSAAARARQMADAAKEEAFGASPAADAATQTARTIPPEK